MGTSYPARAVGEFGGWRRAIHSKHVLHGGGASGSILATNCDAVPRALLPGVWFSFPNAIYLHSACPHCLVADPRVHPGSTSRHNCEPVRRSLAAGPAVTKRGSPRPGEVARNASAKPRQRRANSLMEYSPCFLDWTDRCGP